MVVSMKSKKISKPTTKSKKALKFKRTDIGAKKKLGKYALANALQTLMKERSGRCDLKFEDAPECATVTMHSVPLSERAGYPLKFPKGSADPKDWKTGGGFGGIGKPKEIIVDFKRADWLPDEWGQGVKCTNVISRSGSGNGGTYTVIMSPDGKCFYHRKDAEAYWGKPFSKQLGRNGQIRRAQLMGKQQVQVVRAQIRNQEFNIGTHHGLDTDAHFFRLLTAGERKCLPSREDFHFCVVSARRANTPQGIQDIFMVQSQFQEAGVAPTWYVDAPSLQEYRALGLKAVVGGKLTEARNKCLDDAARLGKACVQCSDDISAWEYRHGPRAKARTFDALNRACATAQRFIISPVAAARFILAKMRGAPGDRKPHLGGVYMLGSCSRTFASEEFSRYNFCIGDFFVAEAKSKVRFDLEMTLKEDYDFTCAHIAAHGSVMRCDRMTLQVKHYSNSGGAVDERDKKGKKEQMNIAILNKKWPGCFRPNPKRQNEVIMRWKHAPADSRVDGEDDEDEAPSTPSKAAARSTKVTSLTPVKSSRPKPPRAALGLPPMGFTLKPTEKLPRTGYIAQRCKKVAGLRVREALGRRVGYVGQRCKKAAVGLAGKTYKASDMKYDLQKGFLVARRG